jgi:hypothetical protein
VLKDFSFPLIHRLFHWSAFLNLHLCVLVYLSVGFPPDASSILMYLRVRIPPVGRTVTKGAPLINCLFTLNGSIHAALVPFSVTEGNHPLYLLLYVNSYFYVCLCCILSNPLFKLFVSLHRNCSS